MENLNTKNKVTWCPGCYNFQILSGFKNFISNELKKGKKKDDFAIVSGIGCHAKIFDYINLNGINTLHGRVVPTCLGLKIGNPNLNVFGFSGDGDAYAEGISHLVHAARYNADFNYVVHNNQVFALTAGQSTPTSEIGFKDKTNPVGNVVGPFNPIKLMLSLNASFVARVFADSKQIEYVFNEALNHKGFAFIEVIQPCLIFHKDEGFKEKLYNLQDENHDITNMEQAMKKADEFDYDTSNKIPIGIFYKKEREVLENKIPQLKNLKKDNKSWKDIDR